MRRFLLKILLFYQKILSPLSFGSCRYYPSCSNYAKLQFENNPLLTAFYNTFTRIASCNQLFEGGIDYPVLYKLEKNPSKLDTKSIKYWLVPNKKNRFYIVENYLFKGRSCLTK